MEYGLLTQETNFMNIAPAPITEQSGLKHIMTSIEDAVKWLSTNTENRLIITMPLDETNRRNIATELGEFTDRITALDPEILLIGSTPKFPNTKKLQLSILRQIKELVMGESVSA